MFWNGVLINWAWIKLGLKKKEGPHEGAFSFKFQLNLLRWLAEIENCPVGTVKTRIMHAKKNLLSIMKKDKIN